MLSQLAIEPVQYRRRERLQRAAAPRGAEDLVVSLIGWVGDPDLPEGAAWPPPWPPRPNAPDGVGVLTRKLGLNQDEYERCCELAEELAEDRDFQRAVGLVARAAMAPMIDHEGLEILRQAADFPELEGAALCST